MKKNLETGKVKNDDISNGFCIDKTKRTLAGWVRWDKGKNHSYVKHKHLRCVYFANGNWKMRTLYLEFKNKMNKKNGYRLRYHSWLIVLTFVLFCLSMAQKQSATIRKMNVKKIGGKKKKKNGMGFLWIHLHMLHKMVFCERLFMNVPSIYRYDIWLNFAIGFMAKHKERFFFWKFLPLNIVRLWEANRNRNHLMLMSSSEQHELWTPA